MFVGRRSRLRRRVAVTSQAEASPLVVSAPSSECRLWSMSERAGCRAVPRCGSAPRNSCRAPPATAAPPRAEQPGKDAGRAGPRTAEPADRAIGGHKGRGLQVTDQPVIADLGIACHKILLPPVSTGPAIWLTRRARDRDFTAQR